MRRRPCSRLISSEHGVRPCSLEVLTASLPARPHSKGTLVTLGNASGAVPPFAPLRLGAKNLKGASNSHFELVEHPAGDEGGESRSLILFAPLPPYPHSLPPGPQPIRPHSRRVPDILDRAVRPCPAGQAQARGARRVPAHHRGHEADSDRHQCVSHFFTALPIKMTCSCASEACTRYTLADLDSYGLQRAARRRASSSSRSHDSLGCSAAPNYIRGWKKQTTLSVR